jgi:hypothetical protein
LLFAGLGGGGCEHLPADSCVARGTASSYDGQLASTLVVGQGVPMITSTVGKLTVVDWTRDCTYEQEEFPVEVLGCRVWVRLEPGDKHQDESDPVPAVVVGGQACTLALPQGAVRVSIASGALTFPGGKPAFTLDGAVAAIGGVSTLGSVQLSLVAD